MKNLFFILFIESVLFANAQIPNQEPLYVPSWKWALKGKTDAGVSSTSNSGNSIVSDLTGNIYVIGDFSFVITLGDSSTGDTTLSAGTSGTIPTSTFIAKYTPNGILVWARAIKVITGFTTGFSIRTTPNANHLFISGVYRGTVVIGNDTVFSSGVTTTINTFVARMDINGNFLWARTSGTSSTTANVYTGNNTLAVDGSGNIYLGGNFHESAIFGTTTLTQSICPGSFCDDTEPYLVKYDLSGNIIWVRQGFGSPSGLNAVTVDYFGNSYLTGGFKDSLKFGSVKFTGGPGVTIGHRNFYIIKHDANGNVLTGIQAIQNTHRSEGFALAYQYGTNNIFVSVNFQDSAQIGSLILTTGTANTKTALLRYNSNLALIGGFQESGINTESSINGMVTDINDNVYVAGNFSNGHAVFALYSDTIIITHPNLSAFLPLYKLFLMKVAPGGASIPWTRREIGTGGFSSGLAVAVGLPGNNNIYATGVGTNAIEFENRNVGNFVLNETSLFGSAEDFFFLAKAQNTEPTFAKTYVVEEATTSKELPGFIIYPNPVQDVIHIEYSKIPEARYIRILNVLNQLILEIPINHNNTKTMINTEMLESGIYIIHILENKDEYYSTKFIKY